MNQELRRLLGQAGYAAADDPDLWARTVMQHNSGPIPRPEALGGNFMLRGFHLVLMDAAGRPTHFAKCRSSDDSDLARESRFLEILGSDPALQRTIPPTRSASSEVMRIQLSEWLQGPTLALLGPSLNPAAWRQTALAILGNADLVGNRAAEHLPELAGPERVNPAEAVTESLRVLKAAGAEPTHVTSLQDALAAAPSLPRRLQHGDLWPANALLADSSWWLLDLEAYGSVQIPLYDVFHLLRSIPHRRGHLRRWLSVSRHAPEYPWVAVTRSVLADFARDLHLSADAVGGAYLSYLVDFTARMHGDGVPAAFAEPYAEELELVARDLQGGVRLDELVPLGLGDDHDSNSD